MNNGTIAAIFVTIFGCVLILAAVFLSYKWRQAKLTPSTPISTSTPTTPPMHRYRVRHGRMVPMSNKNSIISSRSGWASLRPLSMFSSRAANKSDNMSVANLSVRETALESKSPEKSGLDTSWSRHKSMDVEAQIPPAHTTPRLCSPSPELIRTKSKTSTKDRTSVRSWHKLPNFPESTIFENAIQPTSPENPAVFIKSNQQQTCLESPSRNNIEAPPAGFKMATTHERTNSNPFH